MHRAAASYMPPSAEYEFVHSVEDIGELIKASEIVRGEPGCDFVVQIFSHTFHFKIREAVGGFELQSGAPESKEVIYVTRDELAAGVIGVAGRRAMLFGRKVNL